MHTGRGREGRGVLAKGHGGETTTGKPAAGSSGRQRWSGGVPRREAADGDWDDRGAERAISVVPGGEEAVAGVRLGVADPREETAQSGVDRGGEATQMEMTNTAAISGWW